MDDELKYNLEAGFNKLFNSPVIIKKKKRDQALKKKALFVSLITQYEISLNKSVKLQEEFAIDLFDYEGSYYEIIDKLMLLMWGGSIYEIITYYLYERLNLDGSLNGIIETNEAGEETEVFLKTPEELYNYLVQVNPNFLNEK
jgi:PIN domain nuclease of toxin-antitoxin system